MIRPDGKKKAYIRLDAGADSLSLANKMGIIWKNNIAIIINRFFLYLVR